MGSVSKGARRVYLYEDQETLNIRGALPIVCNNSFFSACTRFGLDADTMIKKLVRQKVFLLTYDQKNYRFYILTENAILSCALAEDGHFSIINLREKTVPMQNKFIRFAVKIRADRGAVVWYGHEVHGNSMTPDEAQKNFSRRMPYLFKKMNDLQMPVSEEEEVDEDYEVSDELDDLLTMAEYYVIAEDEIQKSLAQSGPQISYFDYEAAEDYNRIDKIALQFSVYDLDQNVYKKQTRVIVELENDESVNGSIIELNDDESPIKLTILFDKEFHVHLLSPVGIISLEYNSVQRNVRESVIEDLRTGVSNAKYLDSVVGNDEFAGFSKTNLKPLVERLKNSPRPPNVSQIEAIKKGIETDDALLVLGPPGTGKTTVILEWVKYFVLKEHKRVLISSQNNKAVDNVLERLAEEKKIDTIRVGSEEKVQTNVQHLMFEQRAYDLQQTIANANEKYTAKLLKAKRAVEAYLAEVEKLGPPSQQLEKVYMQLATHYDKLQKMYLDDLVRIKKKEDYQKARLEKIQKEADRDKARLQAWRHSPWWKKLFTLRVFFDNKKMIGIYASEYEHEKLQNIDTVKKYNDLASEMQTYRKQSIQPLKDEWRKYQQKLHHMKTRIGRLSVSISDEQTITLSTNKVKGNIPTTGLTNLIKELQELLMKINMARNGLERWRMHLEIKKNYALSRVLLDSVDLVGATCIGINSQPRFQDLEFDVTIIDEAGQIQVHNAMVPMSRSNKVIMLGDHLQIPPIVDQQVLERCKQAQIDTSLLPKSLFEHLYDRFRPENKILLDTQYRMPAEIAELLSHWFYQGKYHSFFGKSGMQTPFPQVFKKPFVLLDTGKSNNRQETPVKGKGAYNIFEAELVVQILKKILAEYEENLYTDKPVISVEDVGVITPYKLQVNYIRQRVLEEFPNLSKQEVFDLVASLDSFQGQERKVIIYSCTKSNKKAPSEERIGFLKELRRLNVALSRCQEQLVFIGDLPFLATCEYVERDDNGQELVDRNGKTKPGTSEKEFSEFIKLMIQFANEDKAQLLEAGSIN